MPTLLASATIERLAELPACARCRQPMNRIKRGRKRGLEKDDAGKKGRRCCGHPLRWMRRIRIDRRREQVPNRLADSEVSGTRSTLTEQISHAHQGGKQTGPGFQHEGLADRRRTTVSSEVLLGHGELGDEEEGDNMVGFGIQLSSVAQATDGKQVGRLVSREMRVQCSVLW